MMIDTGEELDIVYTPIVYSPDGHTIAISNQPSLMITDYKS